MDNEIEKLLKDLTKSPFRNTKEYHDWILNGEKVGT